MCLNSANLKINQPSTDSLYYIIGGSLRVALVVALVVFAPNFWEILLASPRALLVPEVT